MTLLKAAMDRVRHRALREGYIVTRYQPPGTELQVYLEFYNQKTKKWTFSQLWAVTMFSPNPLTHDMEFGIRKTDLADLVTQANRYNELRGIDRVNDPKLIVYVETYDEFYKIPLQEAIIKGRVYKPFTIHAGGTVFIRMLDCAPLASRPTDRQVTL